jgi:hypothetical protein
LPDSIPVWTIEDTSHDIHHYKSDSILAWQAANESAPRETSKESGEKPKETKGKKKWTKKQERWCGCGIACGVFLLIVIIVCAIGAATWFVGFTSLTITSLTACK